MQLRLTNAIGKPAARTALQIGAMSPQRQPRAPIRDSNASG